VKWKLLLALLMLSHPYLPIELHVHWLPSASNQVDLEAYQFISQEL
jgi:hypothetical protein